MYRHFQRRQAFQNEGIEKSHFFDSVPETQNHHEEHEDHKDNFCESIL
jgi:hypothetical protein